MKIDLAGTWHLTLHDAAEIATGLPVTLPGSLTAQGIGRPVGLETDWTGTVKDPAFFEDDSYAPYRAPGTFAVPFWLQPDVEYCGLATYERTFEVPASAPHQAWILTLERPHGVTRVWIDGANLGGCDALGVPHRISVPPLGAGEHTLSLEVDNRALRFVGLDAHSISDHTQGNWNGVVGRMELTPAPVVEVRALQTRYYAPERRVEVTGSSSTPAQLTARLLDGDHVLADGSLSLDAPGAFQFALTARQELPEWDEFRPHLVTLELTAVAPEGTVVETRTVGMRDVGTDRRHVTVNGRRIFLRGTLDCCIFPNTGYPPTEPAEWERLYRVCLDHGLNHVRFHSYCPPAAAFEVADRLGVYLQVEAGVWNCDHDVDGVGAGGPLDEWLNRETDRILAEYGHHPSFILMAHGNEPSGPYHPAFLADWVRRCQERDPNRLYTTGAGWPVLEGSDVHNTPTPRIQAWGEGLASRINAQPPATTADYRDQIEPLSAPVIAHEIGQWCMMPDFDHEDRYTGPLWPRSHRIFRDRLAENGLTDVAPQLKEGSARLQLLCYREEIESALRTPNYGGFQLLGLQDFPGQGTATVGIVDAHWQSKGVVSAEEFRRFCGPTVPLARLNRRVFTQGEALNATIEVSHFGPADLSVEPRWSLTRITGEVLAEGTLGRQLLPTGGLTPVGRITVDVPHSSTAEELSLRVELGSKVENEWAVWSYPTDGSPAHPPQVRVVHHWDDAIQADVEAGARLLVLLPPDDPRLLPSVAIGFSTIFWNTAWTQGQPPHTMGITCDPADPVLRGFPTASHSDWQWWYPLTASVAMDLRAFPDARPVVRLIDDWFTSRPLGLIAEVRRGEGRAILTSIDLTAPLDPVNRHLKRTLFQALS